MSDVFSYDEAVADSAHGDLQGVISALQASLDDLSGFVSRVKSNWDGDEMDLYGGVQAKWDSSAATVRQILDSVHQALGSTTSSVKDMRGQVRGALQNS
jgi:WXG100 family type VII secretion target